MKQYNCLFQYTTFSEIFLHKNYLYTKRFLHNSKSLLYEYSLSITGDICDKQIISEIFNPKLFFNFHRVQIKHLSELLIIDFLEAFNLHYIRLNLYIIRVKIYSTISFERNFIWKNLVEANLQFTSIIFLWFSSYIKGIILFKKFAFKV